MADELWPVQRKEFRSEDLPRYLRIARLQGHLWEWVQREHVDADTLAEDLLVIVENIKHRVELQGQPQPIDNHEPEKPR